MAPKEEFQQKWCRYYYVNEKMYFFDYIPIYYAFIFVHPVENSS